MMADWVSRQCATTGETPHQVLQRVVDESGGKWVLIGLYCGMTHQAAINMFRRHGFEKKPSRNIVFDGVEGSVLSHCKRLGIHTQALTQYCLRNGKTRVQGLEDYKAGRVVRHYWGRPKA